MSLRDDLPFDEMNDDEEFCPCGLMMKNDCAGECGFPYPLATELDQHLTRTPPHPLDGDEEEDDEC